MQQSPLLPSELPPIHPSESLEVLNRRLVDYFGRWENNWARWKLFYSENFFEKRMVYSTKEGFPLLVPVAEERRKAEYIKNRYILCLITPVPEISQFDTCGMKYSYEPMWTFEDPDGTPTPVLWPAIQMIINLVEANVAKGPSYYAKYKQDEKDGNTKEAMEAKIQVIQEQMFGNETAITDSLSLDSAVGYGVRQRNDWLK